MKKKKVVYVAGPYRSKWGKPYEKKEGVK